MDENDDRYVIISCKLSGVGFHKLVMFCLCPNSSVYYLFDQTLDNCFRQVWKFGEKATCFKITCEKSFWKKKKNIRVSFPNNFVVKLIPKNIIWNNVRFCFLFDRLLEPYLNFESLPMHAENISAIFSLEFIVKNVFI